MLKGIDPLLTPDLLRLLADMGHDDALVLADANFTAVRLAAGKPKEAKQFAERALASLPEGSPGWLRAQDIQFVADQEDKDN